jgi:hypothetical protein
MLSPYNNTQPQNINLLQQTKFILAFARIPNSQYFCQEVNLPGISISETLQTTPFIDIHRPGDKMTYDTLDISFIVNEDLSSWTDIHDWIRGMAFPDNFDEYSNLKNLSPFISNQKAPQYCDASLQIQTALNNRKFLIEFSDLYPISLSGINFTTTDDNNSTVTARASFRFTQYKLKRV